MPPVFFLANKNSHDKKKIPIPDLPADMCTRTNQLAVQDRSLQLAGVFFLGALVLAIPAGILYQRDKTTKASFWQSTCVVTECLPAYPSLDTVTFKSCDVFNHTISEVIKNGCRLYPVQSTVLCYVNKDRITFAQFGGIRILIGAYCSAALVGCSALALWVAGAMWLVMWYNKKNKRQVTSPTITPDVVTVELGELESANPV